MKILDLTGNRFGRLVAIEIMPERFSGLIKWKCRCDCGKIKIALAKTLRNGGTKSCGCLYIEESINKCKLRAKPLWSKRVSAKGYVEIKTNFGYMREHIYIMEKHIGRKLVDDEVVHHIDRNKQNNNIDNLQLMTHGEHTALHNKEGY